MEQFPISKTQIGGVKKKGTWRERKNVVCVPVISQICGTPPVCASCPFVRNIIFWQRRRIALSPRVSG